MLAFYTHTESEVQLGGNLGVARRVRLAGNLAEALRHGNVGCRVAEYDAIESVECFEAQLEVQALFYREALERLRSSSM